MEICKNIFKLILIIILFFFKTTNSFSDFNNFQNKKTSYLDFLLLKWENKLLQKSKILAPQAMAWRVQYQALEITLNLLEDQNKIVITLIGYMNKKRYTQKKYKPKNTDCNIVRNLIFVGSYGYSPFRQKKNGTVDSDILSENFKSDFLSNLSLSDKEINFLTNNTYVEVQIISPIENESISCSGKVIDDELR